MRLIFMLNRTFSEGNVCALLLCTSPAKVNFSAASSTLCFSQSMPFAFAR
jgi:hypothetical protein